MAAAGLYKGYTYLVLSEAQVDRIDAAAPMEQPFVLSRTIDDALSVSLGELVDGSVDEDALADAAVTEDKIADSAVTTDKMADESITQGKIGDEAVGTSQIEDDAVTTAKIAANNVTTTELAVDVLQKATLSITATQLRKLNATPLSVVAAPGANKAVLVESFTAKMTYGSVAFDAVGAGDDLVLRYTDGSGTILAQIETVGFLDQSSNQVRVGKPTTTAGSAGLVNLTPTANAAVVAHILAGEIAAADDNANGDSTLLITVYYRVLDV